MSDTDAYATQSIAAGSQSFAAAAKLFPRAMRRDATALYAWCRHCDDVVDGQSGGHGRVESEASPAARLVGLERDTRLALEGGDGQAAALHPAFAALRGVAQRNAMPRALFFDHLDGFRLDVEGRRYRTLEDLLGYCYGVAGVVGVMMAHVMGARDAATLDRACDLGLAFQMTNIARDVVEDAGNGRVYLPLDWLRQAGVPVESVGAPEFRAPLAGVAARLVGAAEPYYDSAAVGLSARPGARPGRSAWRAACTGRSGARCSRAGPPPGRGGARARARGKSWAMRRAAGWWRWPRGCGAGRGATRSCGPGRGGRGEALGWAGFGVF